MTQSEFMSLQRLLALACEAEPRETRATLASFALVMLLMGSYYILRPVRDAMASDWTDAEVSVLWTLTFFLSFAVVLVYGAVASRVSVRRLVPGIYGFFALSFVLFYLGTRCTGAHEWVDKGLYLWVSLFSLFHISIFWSFMADTFTQQQSKRLFAFIGAGASVGAIAGPAMATVLAGSGNTESLLLIAAVAVLITLPLVAWVQRLKLSDLGNVDFSAAEKEYDALGGNPLGGVRDFFTSPYLLGIGLFIFLYTSIGSFVYFELKNLLADFSRADRTQIWAAIDLAVNTLTLLIALFATGRIATRLGLPFTLSSVPLLIACVMLLLAAAPSVAAVVAIQIIRRAGNYAISRPAREMLFTTVDREARFKAKPVIDIVVYRGGDMLNAWGFTALTQGLGLGIAATAGVGAGIALLWVAVGIALGRAFERRGAVNGSVETPRAQ